MRCSAVLVPAAALLTGCGDGSVPFALSDGCYYAEDGKPILKVLGAEGFILTPNPAPNRGGYTYTSVRRVRLKPRIDRDGAYLEVSPGFYLTDSHEAAQSTQPTGRFAIDTQVTPPQIMVATEAYGAIPVRLGPLCRDRAPSLRR